MIVNIINAFTDSACFFPVSISEKKNKQFVTYKVAPVNREEIIKGSPRCGRVWPSETRSNVSLGLII